MPTQHKVSVIIGLVSGIIGVLTAIVALPFMAGNISSDVSAHTKRLDIQRADIDGLQKDVSSLKTDVQGMKNDMSWVRMNIEKMLDMQIKHYRVSEANYKILQKETGR